jgi:hypothetical protein
MYVTTIKETISHSSREEHRPEHQSWERFYRPYVYLRLRKRPMEQPKNRTVANHCHASGSDGVALRPAIFEGLKATLGKDDTPLLFRPEENAKRLNFSADRMGMPAFPKIYS